MRLSEKAMLVQFKKNMPGQSKQDKETTERVLADAGASKEAGRWVKNLYPKEAIEPAAQVGREAYTFYKEITSPWVTDGQRILNAALHLRFIDKMRQFMDVFASKAEESADRFQDWLAAAQSNQNGMFHREDYPEDALAFRLKFKIDYSFLPIPESEHFIVKMAEDEVAEATRRLEEVKAEAVREGQRELWQRLMEPVQHMVTKLGDPEAKFKNSLVENVREMIRLAPFLNLAENPQVQLVCADIQKHLFNYAPDTLRDSKLARAETARRAQEIVQKMSQYIGAI